MTATEMTETPGARVERCRAAVEQGPRSAAAYYNLGLAYTAKGLVEPAERAYRSALEIDPDLVEAWVNLAGVQLLQWNFDAAVESNREALRRRDDLVQAHYNLGQAHLYRGEAADLVRCCERVVALDPSHAAGHYFLAVGLLATGQLSEARAALTRATALGFKPLPEFLRKLEQAEGHSGHAHSRSEATAPEPPKED